VPAGTGPHNLLIAELLKKEKPEPIIESNGTIIVFGKVR
jgi:hypothetical protein